MTDGMRRGLGLLGLVMMLGAHWIADAIAGPLYRVKIDAGDSDLWCAWAGAGQSIPASSARVRIMAGYSLSIPSEDVVTLSCERSGMKAAERRAR